MNKYEESNAPTIYRKAKHPCPICEERRCHPECPRHPESKVSLRVVITELDERIKTLMTVTAMLAQQVSQLVAASERQDLPSDKSKD